MRNPGSQKFRSFFGAAAPALFFAAIAYLNRIPADYVVSGTDHSFFLDIWNNYRNFFYTWTNSLAYGPGTDFNLQSAIPYYAVWTILKGLGLSDSALQSSLMFLFLAGSYYSFNYAMRSVLPHGPKQRHWLDLFSCAYALNGYTLFLFMHVFGYYYQQVFYIFVPLLAVNSYKLFNRGENSWAGWFFLLFFAAIGFNNPGFLIAWLLAAGALFVAALAAKPLPRLVIVRRMAGLGGVVFLANAFWLVPYFGSMMQKAVNLTNGDAIWSMADWIRWQSSRVIDLLRFMPITSSDKFPYNWPAPETVRRIFIAWSFVYAFFLVIAMLRRNQERGPASLKSALGILLLLVLALGAKTSGPLDESATVIFSLPFLNSLRSFDKFGAMLPFIMLAIIYLGLFYDRRQWRIKAFLLVMLLAYPCVFFTGGLQTKISTAYQKGEDYLSAKYSYLVKMPDDYRRIADLVNAQTDSRKPGKVQYLPFGVINSPGWQQYPKWRFVGTDLTTTLYHAPVQVPAFYLASGKWNYAKQFSMSGDPGWFKNMFGLMNDHYLVFNRDASDNFVAAAETKINLLREQGAITRMYSGKYADLYAVADELRLPQIYSPKRVVVSSADYSQAPQVLAVRHPDLYTAYFFGQSEKPAFLYAETAGNRNGMEKQSIQLFDYGKPEESQPLEGQVYSELPGAVYEIRRSGGILELKLSSDPNRYASVNGRNDFLDMYQKQIKVDLPAGPLIASGNYYTGDFYDGREFSALRNSIELYGSFAEQSDNQLAGSSFEDSIPSANNCGYNDPSMPVMIKSSRSSDSREGRSALRLWSANGAACSMIRLPDKSFAAGDFFKLSFYYKNLKGGIVQAAVWQEGAEQKRPVFLAQTADNEWHKYETVFQADSRAAGLIIFLYSPSRGSGETENLFDDVRLIKVSPKYSRKIEVFPADKEVLFEGGGISIKPAAPSLAYSQNFEEPVSSPGLCGQTDKTKAPLISAKIIETEASGPALELSSENGLACYRQPIEDFIPGHLYGFSVYYRNAGGKPGEAALWQSGADLDFPRLKLPLNREWSEYRAVFKPEAGATKADVFLYSADDEGKESANQYDSVALHDLGLVPENIRAVRKSHINLASPRELDYQRLDPTRYAVSAQGIEGDFMIVFSESFNSKWIIALLPPAIDMDDIGWTSLARSRFPDNEHFMVNGYANGWLVRSDGLCGEKKCGPDDEAVFLIFYWPQLLFYAGAAITIIPGFLLALRYARKK